MFMAFMNLSNSLESYLIISGFIVFLIIFFIILWSEIKKRYYSKK
jgi:hypothetical protein